MAAWREFQLGTGTRKLGCLSDLSNPRVSGQDSALPRRIWSEKGVRAYRMWFRSCVLWRDFDQVAIPQNCSSVGRAAPF